MWDKKHLLDIDSFSREDIESIFKLAKIMGPYSGIDKNVRRKQTAICQGFLMTLWFEPGKENSTRTFGSFPAAMSRLGGNHKVFDETTSSMSKGETIEDTARILSGHSDLIVDRHRDPNHVYNVAKNSTVPVINAGNGSDQHPTQTLLDLHCMNEAFGHIDGLVVVVVGDPKYGRTVHSLMKGMVKFNDVCIVGISPPGLELPKEYRGKNYEERSIDMSQLNKELSDIKPHVVYATRVQKERLPEGEDPKKFTYRIDDNMLKNLPEHTKIMHPLPRVDEIDPGIDKNNKAIYFKQADWGVPVRMAIIVSLLDYEKEAMALKG